MSQAQVNRMCEEKGAGWTGARVCPSRAAVSWRPLEGEVPPISQAHARGMGCVSRDSFYT